MATAQGLMKLTAAALKAACIAMQLVQERDGQHGLLASTVFSPAEIATLAALDPTLHGNSAKQRNPHPTLSLAWTGWVMACLGCWLCYGKPPRPITFAPGHGTLQGDP
jgi:hypothetical protein